MLRPRLLPLYGQRIWRASMKGQRVQPAQVCRRCRCYSSSSTDRRNGPQLPMVEREPPPSHSVTDRIVVPVALLVIGGAGFYLHYNDERRATPVGSSKTSSNTTNRPAIGGSFKLINTENCLVTESDLRGNWVLMYFGYTSSPDVCPEEVKKMAEVIQILERQHNLKITLVFISIDPQRDSPSQLRAFLKEFDPRIIGLTGSISAIRQVAHEYRVFFKKVDEESQDDYLVESSNNMYLLDPNMEMVKYFGVEYDSAELAEGVLNEVKKASK